MRLTLRRAPKRTTSPVLARGVGPGAMPPELLERIRAIEIKARRLVNDLFLASTKPSFAAVASSSMNFVPTSPATTSAPSIGKHSRAPARP
jgi:hypothetical protein